MKEKLIDFIENSEIETDVKNFIIDSLAIEEKRNIRNRKQYEMLVDKYVGDKL